MRTIIWITLFLLLILPVRSQEKRVSLLFAGDAMQHLPQIVGAKGDHDSYHYDSCFYLLKEKIRSVDLAGLNFETTLGGEPYSGYPIFSAPDAFALSLQNAGFDLFFLANNHAVDRGREGVERTIHVLDSAGIRHTGTFITREQRSLHYPLMIIRNGIRIAFLNYTYDTNGLPVKEPNIVNLIDTLLILQDLDRTRLYKPDIIIAQLHWGEEYRTTPTALQKRTARLLLQNGVRIIVGHHPHVIQPIRVTKERNQIRNVVYYSLGNFISNQQRELTDGGMMAEIVIRKKDDASPAEIESCGYSLVWVEKTAQGRKISYRLIPYPIDDLPAMEAGEKQKMDIFVQQAERMIRHPLYDHE